MRLWFFFLAAGIVAAPLQAAEIRVAAASSLSFVADELASAFERTSGHTVLLSLGASGSLYAQLVAGAPFDIFLSADTAYPRRLESDGRVAENSFVVYARGRLSLWLAARTRLKVSEFSTGLAGPRLHRLALANPHVAPYGLAARQALERADIWDRLQGRLVFGESVTQTAHMAKSGAADAAILSASLEGSEALASGKWVEIPDSFYDPIEHAVIILRGRDSDAAREFVSWLTSPAGRALLRARGLWPAGEGTSR